MYDITILGSIVVTCLITIISFFLLKQYYSIIDKKNYLIFVLRFILFIILFFLLLSPVVNWSSERMFDKKINIYIDNSISMKSNLSYDNIDYDIFYNSLIDNMAKSNLDYNIYIFGDSIREVTKQNKFSDIASISSNIKRHRYINNADYSLIITDGHLIEIGFDEFINNDTLHIIGVGLDSVSSDISIKSISTLDNIVGTNDIEMNITIKYNLEFEYSGELLIPTKLGSLKVPVKIPKGIGEVDFLVEISTININKYGFIELSALKDEVNVINNKMFYNLDLLENKNILLVSGSLSNNTNYILGAIRELGFDYTHLYRVNKDIIKLELISEYDVIILDGFPYLNIDLIEIEKLNSNNFVYFQNSTNNKITQRFLKEIFNISTVKHENVKSISFLNSYNNSILNNIETYNLPNVNTNISYVGNKNSELFYSDSSIAISRNNNNYCFLIDDIFALKLKEYNITSESHFDTMIKNYLFYLINREHILELEIKEHQYLLNENIEISVNSDPRFTGGDIYLNIVAESDTSSYILSSSFADSIIYRKSFEESGVKELFLSLALNNNETIYSKSKFIYIMNDDIEKISNYENIEYLSKIEQSEKGKYYQINNIEQLFKDINPNQKSKIVNQQFGVLSLHHFWVLMIILLGFEWFYRKKYGLL